MPDTALFDTPVAHINRDHWDRPMVVPPDGGKPVAYTRCTTFVDCLEDKYNLELWGLRQAAIGLADRPDLLLAVSAHRDNKKKLNSIIKQAKEAAKSSASSTTGTALHALTERVDRGQPLGVLPSTARADLLAYREATRAMVHEMIEQFCVHDGLRVGGTPDRVVKFGDGYYIADIKTGDIEWGALKIAMQLAVYANSTPYHPQRGREPYPVPVDLDRAIVIHLPAGEAVCTLHWIDIQAGWAAAQCADQVRTWRKRKNWYTTIPDPTTPPAIAMRTVGEQIAAARTVDELVQVWTAAMAAQAWTDDNLRQAVARKAELEQAS